MPKFAQAQNAGNKTVYNSNSQPAPSIAWIDASAFWTQGNSPDLCTIVNGILTSATGYGTYPATGAVIDARGLYHINGGQITCSNSPFYGLTASPPPTTILLPASTIPMSATWTLPNNTKLVGAGQNTNLEWAGGSSGYMIEMGSATFCPSTGCNSIGIEHLVLVDSGSLGGIDNKWSQDASYVNDVFFSMFSGTGISIAAPSSSPYYPGATNSGPYSNIGFNSASSGTPVCIDVETQTRGIHGATCFGNTNTSATQGNAAIYVNASNNSIEDIHIEEFWDGIEVGNIPAGAVVGNIVISNINGYGSNAEGGLLTNVVHICGVNNNPNLPFGECSKNNNTTHGGIVSDVTILQAANLNPGYPTPGGTVLQDDQTGTTIQGCPGTTNGCENPLTAGLYILGEATGGVTGSYSRFATNPSYPNSVRPQSSYVPTWSVGSNTSVNGSSCHTPGALYSNTLGDSGNSFTIYVCTYSGTAFSWQPLV